jgi:hypothetical protein
VICSIATGALCPQRLQNLQLQPQQLPGEKDGVAAVLAELSTEELGNLVRANPVLMEYCKFKVDFVSLAYSEVLLRIRIGDTTQVYPAELCFTIFFY